jgi:hypothetical protein
LRIWNAANEIEHCQREASFIELYSLLGNTEAQEAVRERDNNKLHCPYLRRDPNACESLPAGIDGIEPGSTCPHNVYVHQQEKFTARDAVIDTVDRLVRIAGLAEFNLYTESELDPLTATELLVTKNELERFRAEREKREYENRKAESEAKAARPTPKLPSTMGANYQLNEG